MTSPSASGRSRMFPVTHITVQNHYRRALESLLAVDEAVDRMVTALDDAGVLDNTIIVFWSVCSGRSAGATATPAESPASPRSTSVRAMCGRFVSATPPDQIARYFGVTETAEALLAPNYNVAPTTDIYTVLETGGVRRLEPLHWGLVPIWAKDLKIGNRMINARAETLAEKNAFKHAFRKRRCIIPVDGFYEWKKVPGRNHKQPFYIQRADGEPLAFAGLWEVWRGADRKGPPVASATIITGAANDKVAEIHDRMPVMLPPDAWNTWLDPEVDDLDLLGRFFVPAPSELLSMYPVSTEVNNVRNRGEHLVDEIDPDAPDAPTVTGRRE